MGQGHVFFQDIPQRQQAAPENATYLHNTLILEMCNNWPWVRWMMDRHKHDELKKVDPMEKDWLKFIKDNNIDVEKFGKNGDLFVETYYIKTT